MIKQKIQQFIKETTGIDAEVTKPKSDFGDYAVFIKGDTEAIAAKIKAQMTNVKEIDHIEIKGNYINFFLSREFLQEELERITASKDFGLGDSLKGKKIMVEYTDPNPFKQFHIGHLMSNAIGESIARLYEVNGAKVIRVNYQGDVGLHVAKAVWGLQQGKQLWEAYAYGNQRYDDDRYDQDSHTIEEIDAINKKLYDRSDPEINKRYDEGRKVSLEYFEKQYERLGTKFVHYFFESEMGPKGHEIVRQHPEVFEKSDGAVVFKGEEYGLHTRVFVNSAGLPTYEAKELGLNQEKFKLYNPDISIIVTGNEIVAYFNVLLKVTALVLPDVASKTRHIPHGMMRLKSGKMSSRTGEVITADELIEQVKEKVGGKEEVAIGAIKYSILKQSIGHDIIFDFDKSLSVQGDSGVYLQYTFARLQSILSKSDSEDTKGKTNFEELIEKEELDLIKHLIEFPDAVEEASSQLAPHRVALFLYELANKTNCFYEQIHILTDENIPRKSARLLLIKIVADILKRGLSLLGIEVLNKI